MADTPKTRKQVFAEQPLRFLGQATRNFFSNQGLLLAGAVAYYTLLSVIPMLLILLLGLSHFVDEARLMATLGESLSLLVPVHSEGIIENVQRLLDNRGVIGPLMLILLLFFSSWAFSVLESAFSVIFLHRVVRVRRHPIISVSLPYLFIVSLAVGILLLTTVTGWLQIIAEQQIVLQGYPISLNALARFGIHALGFIGLVVMLASVYMAMPVGSTSFKHALIGGAVAATLWEITRAVLIWYFAQFSVVDVVYGSLAAPIVLLLTLEIAAIILLFGAQVIADYENLEHPGDVDDEMGIHTG